MQAREHTNLLSIFALIYAGIQGLFVLLYLLIALIYGGIGVMAAFSAKRPDAAPLIFIGLFVVLFVVICMIGLIGMIANIRMGKLLRGNTPPTQRTMIVTAILNFISWFCGGIFLLPFGIGLGVYGLWFTLSDMGKAYLSGQVFSPNYSYPPDPGVYHIDHSSNPYPQTTQDPYKWQ